ncbi:protein containing DUF1566 [Candidatus Magnetomorum sp. HK-1]|nr:protein containing DUF1566 [Candidatus Magnetomorum sp. HK-1]
MMQKHGKLSNFWIYSALIIAFFVLECRSFAYEIELNEQGNSYALLIGINEYTNHSRLNTPINNVETLGKILTDQFDFQPEHIIKVTDQSPQPPTSENIENHIIYLGERLTEKDQLLIFFSGHSQMDENGETYWIPINGYQSHDNWLSHRYLIQTLIAKNLNTVRHIAIFSDGYFSGRLFNFKLAPPEVPETQYKEWLKKKTYLKSREILALNDQYWENNDKTNGLGLFAYYFTQALSHNKKRRVALESLLFGSELIQGPIESLTGVSVVYGRLKNSGDQGGQFILEKAKVLPKVKVSDCQINPTIGYVDDLFLISCQTTGPASRVNIQINGQKFPMVGNGMRWNHQTRVETSGKSFYYVTSYNNENVKGEKYKGSLETVSPSMPICNVVSARVSPQKGRVGETFHFKAQTDIPAHHVHLYIDDERYVMNGKSTKWTYSKSINTMGQMQYKIVTSNEAGIIGQMKDGTFQTNVPVVDVIKTKVMPEWGYIGEPFVFTSSTNKAAQEVFLEINGQTYAMKGAGRDWSFKTEINTPGLVEYRTVALNQMKKKGKALSANFSVSRKPLEIPDVMDISVLPDTVYKGESILIHAKTSSPAKIVYIELENQKDILRGNGTDWFYKTTIHKSQNLHFRIIAKNHRGMQGLAQDSSLRIKSIPSDTIKIIHAEVKPKNCDVGSDIFFHVLTDKPAKQVDVILEGDKIPLQGRDREWQLTQTIDLMGLIYYAIIPIDKRKIKGQSYIGHIEVSAGNPEIKRIRISPEKPSIDEEVTIHAHTDKPARRMTLLMGNITYPMTGSKRDFYFKHTYYSAKSHPFVLQPFNLKNVSGTKKQGKLEIFEPELPVPQVISVDIKPMETGFFFNERLLFSAQTDVPAKRTLLTLNGQSIEMNGVKKIWHLIYSKQKTGLNEYAIETFNEKGQSGKVKSGQFQIYEKKELPVNVTSVQVVPKQGLSGDLFYFSATTNRPANRVVLTISDTVYEMSGMDQNWQTQLNGYKSGKINFHIAAFNQSDIDGMIQTDYFTVLAPIHTKTNFNERKQAFIPLPPEERFLDHKNGTVTDKSTQLMWLKNPKTIPENYDAAIGYCRSLNIEGFTNWRLPTIEEWKKTIDPEQQNPALPKGHPFESLHTGIGYWSKTTHRFGPQYVYQMKLWYGKVGYMKKSQRALVWPVRYAGFD